MERTLGPCKPKVKDTAYNMLVRPKFEYASPIWNPHASSQINRLERIQHYAARFVANDHRRTTSPTTLVLILNWQTLERRRTIKQPMTFYKILNNIIEINPPTYGVPFSHLLYLQLNWRYLQLICRYLQFIWRYLRIG